MYYSSVILWLKVSNPSFKKEMISLLMKMTRGEKRVMITHGLSRKNTISNIIYLKCMLKIMENKEIDYAKQKQNHS
jgi:hypothetical protein